MRIGELSRKSGLSRDTIRFYEKHRLIVSNASTVKANTYRDYPEDLVERLAMIGEAREAGFSVADLGKLISHLETGGDGNFDADEFLDQMIKDVQRTITQAQKFKRFLEQTKTAIRDGPSEWR